jgi:hypothetical protein
VKEASRKLNSKGNLMFYLGGDPYFYRFFNYPIIYCLIILLSYYPIVLLSYCPIILLFYYLIILLFYCAFSSLARDNNNSFIVLLSYCPIILLSYYSIILLFYYPIFLLSYYLIILLFYYAFSSLAKDNNNFSIIQ